MARRQAGRKRARGAAKGAASLDLRLRPQDRAGPPPARGEAGRHRRAEEAPPRQKGGRRRRGTGRFRLGRLIYWAVVLALWGLIGAIGALVWVGIHLPPIQSLEIPKRPPSVLILGANGATLATRGDMGGAAVPLRELPDYLPGLHRHRGPALLRASRRRSLGHRPRRHS